MVKIFKCQFVILIFSIGTNLLSGQAPSDVKEYNFGFEKQDAGAKLPKGWYPQMEGTYSIEVDTTEVYDGNASLSIELDDPLVSNSFGSVMYSIPAGFQGDTIEVKAYLKFTNVSNGSIGLILSIYGKEGVTGYENMVGQGINGSKDWAQYVVRIPYPEDGKAITVGPMLVGGGKLWADNFQIFVDDILVADKFKVYPADQDREFDGGSKISPEDFADMNVHRLVLLGKVWGFLKYHHPAIAHGQYNWDYELFRILPAVLESEDTEQYRKVLLAWVRSLGGDFSLEHPRLHDDSVKLKPDLAWINKDSLGNELYNELIGIRYAERPESHFYLEATIGSNLTFKNESGYGSLGYEDVGYRLLSLYRYWNIIQYYFPYRDLIGEDWNSVLGDFLPEFISSSDELTYKLTVLEMVTRINDWHAKITYNDADIFEHWGLNVAPVILDYIEGSAVVTGHYTDKTGKETGLVKGDVILSVNGVTHEEFVATRSKFLPSSNHTKKISYLTHWDFMRSNDSVINVAFKRDNTIDSVKVKCYHFKDLTYFQQRNQSDSCFKMIDNIAYINIATLKEGYLEQILVSLKDPKGIIIDFRGYGSVFTIPELGDFLMPDRRPFCKITTANPKVPGLFTFAEDMKYIGKENPDAYTGNVLILVNENTISSGEYQALALRQAPNSRIIGSTTAGADGNVSTFYLPGNVKVRLTAIGVYHTNGDNTQRVGIIPDVYMAPTIEGVKNGQDEVLQGAIELLNGQ